MNVIDDLRSRGITGRLEFYGDHFVISAGSEGYAITATVNAPAVGYALRELANLGDRVEAFRTSKTIREEPR